MDVIKNVQGREAPGPGLKYTGLKRVWETEASRQRGGTPCTEWADYKCSLMFTYAKKEQNTVDPQ